MSTAIAVAAVVAIIIVVSRPNASPPAAAPPGGSLPAAAMPSIVASQIPPTPSPAPPATATPPAAAASEATQSRTVTPKTSRPTTTPPATRITAPSNGTEVAWAATVRYTMSPADLTANSTVVTVSICVSGRCYLDGAIQVENGRPAPHPVHLGSTQGEGVGIGWTLRLDRLPKATYASLTAEREAEIADSSWGDKGTSMSRLNPTPVSAVTVTKTG